MSRPVLHTNKQMFTTLTAIQTNAIVFNIYIYIYKQYFQLISLKSRKQDFSQHISYVIYFTLKPA